MEKAKWNPGWELLKGRDQPALTSGSPAVTQCLAPNRHAVTLMGRREREDREGTRRVRKRQGGDKKGQEETGREEGRGNPGDGNPDKQSERQIHRQEWQRDGSEGHWCHPGER